MGRYINELKQVAEKLKDADAVLIGASNGLSITEGLHLFADNTAFEKLFGDFKRKYGLSCILHGMGAQWQSEEEKWAFWSRLINRYCAEYRETQVMSDLKSLVKDKDYFIITSNGECHFELCGFAPERIYEIEGNWLSMQCSAACHTALYPTLELAKKLASEESGGRVPSESVPRCPRCGAPMSIHMVGGNFIPDTDSQRRAAEFLEKYHNKRLVVLELGIGPRNRLIKAPLMQLTAEEPQATYVTINLGEVYIREDIKDKSFGLDCALSEMLAALRTEYEKA